MLYSSQGSGGRAGRRGPGKKIVVVLVVSSAWLVVLVLSVVVLVVCCNCSKSASCSPAQPLISPEVLMQFPPHAANAGNFHIHQTIGSWALGVLNLPRVTQPVTVIRSF